MNFLSGSLKRTPSFLRGKPKIPKIPILNRKNSLFYSTNTKLHNHLQDSLRFLRTSDHHQGLASVTTYLQTDPNSPQAWSLKGQFHRLLSDYSNSLSSLDKSLQISPTAEAWYQRALTLHGLGNVNEAVWSLEEGLKLDVENKEIWGKKGVFLMEIEGRMREAIRCLDFSLELDERQPEIWGRKGKALMDLGELESGIKCLELSLEMDKGNKLFWVLLGVARAMNNESKDKILECFDKAIEIDPEYVDAYVGKGNCLCRHSIYDAALQSFEKAIQINPETYFAWIGIGNIRAITEENEDGAISCYDKAINIDTENPTGYESKGVLYSTVEKFEKALECLQKSLSLNPNSPNTLFSLSNVQLHLDDPNEALKTVEKGLNINPKDSRGWLYKGRILRNICDKEEENEGIQNEAKKGLNEKIMQCFDVALDLKRDEPLVWLHIALEWKRMGDIQKYEEAVKKATEIDAEFVKFYSDEINK